MEKKKIWRMINHAASVDVILQLSTEMYDKLSAIAEKNNTSFFGVMKHAIALEELYDQIAEDNGRYLIERDSIVREFKVPYTDGLSTPVRKSDNFVGLCSRCLEFLNRRRW